MVFDPPAQCHPAMPCRIGAGEAAPPGGWPLFGTPELRQIEATASATLSAHALMRRAGLATARLALALAPQANRIWFAAGPGNNGGDGFEAAMHLHAAGKEVSVTVASTPFGTDRPPPIDAVAAMARAREAGVRIIEGSQPPWVLGDRDLAIDALLGIGANRAPEGGLRAAIDALSRGAAPVLAIDVPSGLNAESGTRFGSAPGVRARWTLSLLGLKPGLFTAEGRDHAGDVWFDDLGVPAPDAIPLSRLLADVNSLWPIRLHAQHKGSFGDVWVVGGAPGMAGAAVLAAHAALVAGAGRVYLTAFDDDFPWTHAGPHEVMHRHPGHLLEPQTALEQATIVCGCGGGEAVRPLLPTLLSRAGRLLLDADALNAIATDAALVPLLAARVRRDRETILTPHPLEAARLLGIHTVDIQSDRLSAASRLAARHGVTVALKGSGTVIVAPSGESWVNTSGNACLASPGTGDVLAGWIGGLWAQGLDAASAARLGVHSHGAAADVWAGSSLRAGPLTAAALVSMLARVHRG